jgi:hypothetical protein
MKVEGLELTRDCKSSLVTLDSMISPGPKRRCCSELMLAIEYIVNFETIQ